MRFAGLRDKWLSIAIVLMMALTGIQVAFRTRSSPETSGRTRWIDARVGQTLQSEVVDPTSRVVKHLSDVDAGVCRYVVIVSPTCGASIDLSHQWRHGLAHEGSRPKGWALLWVSAGDSTASFEALGPKFPVKLWFSATAHAVAEETKLRAYPVHVILDKQGRVVSSDIGAPLLPPQAYRTDCSIDDSGMQ